MTAAVSPPLRIPGRARPFEKAKIPTPAWQRLLLGRDLSPSRSEYDAIIAATWQGDEAMDALIEWMYAYGPAKARPLFTQALGKGIETLQNPPEPLVRFFNTVEATPAWVDRQLMDDAVHFIHGTGLAAPYVLRDLALMGGYLLSGFNHVLIKTGALNKDASLRIAETGQWWIDCTEIGGLERFNPGFKSTIHVRLVHGMVRRALARKEDWDSEHWGLPVNQIDMVATYLGFCVVMLGGLRKLGIPVTSHESKAVMHLWAYAGWLMGVDEKWLVFNERDGIVLLSHTFMSQSRPDWTSKELARALADEPLHRHFNNFADLRGKLAYYQHLSVSRYFLGKQKMAQLGLPEDIPGWFPLLTAVPRLANYSIQHFLPPLRKQQEKRGRAAQLATLQAMFGDREKAIGHNRDQAGDHAKPNHVSTDLQTHDQNHTPKNAPNNA